MNKLNIYNLLLDYIRSGIIFVLILSNFQNVAYSDNSREVNESCKNNENYQLCVRLYQGLPPIPSSRTHSRRPIRIRVVPYLKRTINIPNLPSLSLSERISQPSDRVIR